MIKIPFFRGKGGGGIVYSVPKLRQLPENRQILGGMSNTSEISYLLHLSQSLVVSKNNRKKTQKKHFRSTIIC